MSRKKCVIVADIIRRRKTQTLHAVCMAFYVLSDFLEQKSWSSETVEKYPGGYIFFYPKFHCELNVIEMIWVWT